MAICRPETNIGMQLQFLVVWTKPQENLVRMKFNFRIQGMFKKKCINGNNLQPQNISDEDQPIKKIDCRKEK